MPDVRYVCLSDLHFGAANSILTELPNEKSKSHRVGISRCAERLVECLRTLVAQNESRQRPELVLHGDTLEFALAEDNTAAMAFERFMLRVCGPDGIFADKVVYVPGNHDHHLWETARERAYAEYLRTVPAGKPLNAPWHANRMFPDPEKEKPVTPGMLTALLRDRHPTLNRLQLSTVYPNYGLVSDDGRRGVVVHHGHLVEHLYRLMTILKPMFLPNRKPALDVWEWEAENFAWIDFFWSTLGRSGDAGLGVGLIYAMLGSEQARDFLIGNLTTGLSNLAEVPDFLRPVVRHTDRPVEWLVSRVTGIERGQLGGELSEHAEGGLSEYVSGPLLRQLRRERDGEIPPELAFVFGHTHKPFERRMPFLGYKTQLNVYNSGGWVVDSTRAARFQGAAAILVDEECRLASLRFYNQHPNSASYRVRVCHPGDEDVADNPFFQRLVSLVQPDKTPWRQFSTEAAAVVKQRRQDLRRVIAAGMAKQSTV